MTEVMDKIDQKEHQQYATVVISDQLFGIAVECVQDVLAAQNITRIPLAPPEVAGALNLRGRIVTAIDVRTRLGLPPIEQQSQKMSVVVEYKGEPYSLNIDAVGEVLTLPLDRFEANPPTLDAVWRDISTGVYRLDGKLLVIVDVERLLNINLGTVAA